MFIREQTGLLHAQECFQDAFVDVFVDWPGFWTEGTEYEDGSVLFLIGA